MKPFDVIPAEVYLKNQLRRARIRLKKHSSVQENGCWNYQQALSNGYGQIWFMGTNWRAHRLSMYAFRTEEFKSSAYICHTCDNTMCVNPEHLFIGDSSSNMLDAVKKGRHSETSKTHCERGHAYDEKNTYTVPGTNHRHCRECTRINQLYYSMTKKGV